MSLIGLYYRVVVPFGAKHFYTGIVIDMHDRRPAFDSEIKELFSILDEKPVIRNQQLYFWQWISSYYLCSRGEVCRAALPARLKIESETFISLNVEYANSSLKPNEQKIIDTLSSSPRLSVSDIEKKTGIKQVFPIINSLLTMGAVLLSETMKKGFKPKTETFLYLADHIRTDADFNRIFEDLKRAKQQEKLFFDFLDCRGEPVCSPNDEAGESQLFNYSIIHNYKKVSKRALLEYSGVNVQALNGLIQRGILVAEAKALSRIDLQSGAVQAETLLTLTQQQTLEEIKKSFETKDITLLHGVTSGGKTEIYIRLIQETLYKGLQALYLLPEIALTTQVEERLRKVFGSRLFVYNSGIADNERVEIWNHQMLQEEPAVVLGVRSSIFLPFARIGLVIVDEEHDPSYKQQDPAPRYHARNAVLMLAQIHKAKTLLGSAAPSLESYLWAKKEKYGYVRLDEQYEGSLKPMVEIVNVCELRRKKRMKNTLFSPLLKEKIEEALSKGEQVVLFQNRRGFAPLITCGQCEKIPHCMNCDVCLTYHKVKHRLMCHYCGYAMPFPLRCPSCSSDEMKLQGFGTEKVEEEVVALFPSVKVARLDVDTARKESAYRRILSDFEEGKTQLLIGTQMLPKELGRANVSVAGILNADGMLNIPDFRAYERAFQLICQIGDHAVRRDRRGIVVIQTSQDQNPLLRMVKQWDYSDMAQTQLEERFQFHYPPYTRLTILVLRSRNESVLDELAEIYASQLRKCFGGAVSGPVYPPVTRVQTLFVRKIMLKADLSIPVSETRKVLEEIRIKMSENPLYKQIILHYDVDPQ